MSAISRISQWPLVSLLGGIVCQCLSAGVLAVPDRLRRCILEPDHIMLPGNVNHAYPHSGIWMDGPTNQSPI